MTPSPTIKQLERKVFTRTGASADARFFRKCIADWMQSDSGQLFSPMLVHAVWLRNDQGKTTHYMNFNEKAQRLYLDRDFRTWAERMREEIGEALTKLAKHAQ